MKAKITKETKLKEVLERPDAIVVLEKYSVPCLFCPMAAMEAGKLTLDEIAKMYEIDLEGLLKELNKPIKK